MFPHWHQWFRMASALYSGKWWMILIMILLSFLSFPKTNTYLHKSCKRQSWCFYTNHVKNMMFFTNVLMMKKHWEMSRYSLTKAITCASTHPHPPTYSPFSLSTGAQRSLGIFRQGTRFSLLYDNFDSVSVLPLRWCKANCLVWQNAMIIRRRNR